MQKNSAKCPTGLQKYIDLANIYHEFQNANLTDLNLAFDLLKVLDKEPNDFPKQLKDYLFSNPNKVESLLKKTALISAYTVLSFLAFKERQANIHNDYDYLEEIFIALTDGSHSYPVGIGRAHDNLSSSLWVKDGVLKHNKDEFIVFIEDNQFEVRRIRLCDRCDKIFWAPNVNSRTCSKECRDALKQRKWRFRNREEYNLKRRENYSRNKQLEARRASGKTLGTLKDRKEKKNGGL